MPANDIYELSVDAVYGSENMTTVLHWLQVGSDGTGDPRDALNQIWVASFDAPQRLSQVVGVVHFQQRVRRLFPTQTQSLITANAGVGTMAGDGLPTNQCAILRMYGVLSGPRGIGHQKLYGIPTSLVLRGRVLIAYRDAVEPYGLLFTSDTTVANGWKFRAGVLGVDNVCRAVQKTDILARVKQVHSRSARVGI